MILNQRKAGALLSYTLTGMNLIVGFIYIPLLIHFLGKEEYGLYQLMGSFLVYLTLFDFGLSTTVTRYYSKYIALQDEKGKENLLALSSVIYGIFTIILVTFGIILYFNLDNLFASSLTYTEIASAKKMFIIILITVAITLSTSVFSSVISSHERFVFLRVLSISQIILRPIVVLAIFTVEASAFIVVLVQALIIVLGVALKIYYSLKKLSIKIKLHYWDFPLLKEMFKFSFFIFITVIMDQIFWRADQIILGIIVGTAAVAVYSIGSQLVMYFMSLSTAMSGVFLPNITKKVTNNASTNELTSILVKIGRLQYIIIASVLVGFTLFGKEFLAIWLGDGYEQAYYITLIIMIPFVIDLIQNIGLTILQAKNMYSFRASVFFIMSLLNIGFSIPLAIYYGGIGAAVATGISYLIGNGIIMNIYYYKKVSLDIVKFWKEIGKLSVPVCLALISGVFINEISLDPPLLSFLLKLLIYLILYIVLIWIIGMNKYEKSLILGPLKKN